MFLSLIFLLEVGRLWGIVLATKVFVALTFVLVLELVGLEVLFALELLSTTRARVSFGLAFFP
jgi:hypothetical protein